jgi:hypothetical protein
METPFLRKMCFGYLYNLHTLNGSEETNELEGSDEEPMNIMKKSQYLFESKKKEFKLYNDFSHCPIISKETWHKKLDTPVAATETLKRQITHIEDKGTEHGPVEKKRKEENDATKFNLNRDKDDTQSMEVMDEQKKMEGVTAVVMAGGQNNSLNQNHNHNSTIGPIINHNHVQSNSSQNANGTYSIPNTASRMKYSDSETDDDDGDYGGSSEGGTDGDDDSGAAIDIEEQNHGYRKRKDEGSETETISAEETRPNSQ